MADYLKMLPNQIFFHTFTRHPPAAGGEPPKAAQAKLVLYMKRGLLVVFGCLAKNVT